MKKRKILALVIVFTMIASSLTVGYSAMHEFSDMPDNWSTEALQNAVHNGLLNGADGKIMPTDNLTRAQMATVINRAFGAEVKADIQNYTDVPSGAWYYDEMAKAVQMKTFQGSENMLSPDDAITREQAFIVMARALKLGLTDVEPEGFSDLAEISSWAKDEVFSMIEAGYVKGSNGKLNPKATITRAEFAQLMDNLIKQYISVAGEYTEVVDGNIMINVPDVTLKDVTVTGDLIIGDGVGDGDVTLDGVEVTGRLLIRGGGNDTIIIRGNSNIRNIIIARVDGIVRVYNETGEEIGEVIVDGSDDVILEGVFGNIEILADNVDVYALRAVFSDSNLSGDNSRIILPEVDTEPKKDSVRSVSIGGDADFIGSTISAIVAPSNATVAYKWLISDTADAGFVEIEGEVTSDYGITADDIGRFIKVEVRGTGDYTRTRTSEAVAVGFGGFDADIDAHEISNWHHLNNIRYVLDGDFVMTANLGVPEEEVIDLVMPEITYETKGYYEVVGVDGFEPIGLPMIQPRSVTAFGEETDFLSQLFTGSFDGDNHVIDGLYVDREMNVTSAETADISNAAGLFGIIYQADIRNLTIKNSGVFGAHYVGALAGYSRESTITNVHNDSDNNMTKGSGPQGFVLGYSRVGGIVGINDSGTVVDSSNDSFVIGEEYVGGIAGSSNAVNGDASPSVMILSEVPNLYESYITDSWNEGWIIGHKNVGGIAGSNGREYDPEYLGGVQSLVSLPEVPSFINGCYNSGLIAPIDSRFSNTGDNPVGLGGIAGYNTGTISESYNEGNVGDEMRMSLALSNVEISGVSYEAFKVGGLVGSDHRGKILNSYNKGDIYGAEAVGGIVGYADSSEITNNYNVGNITVSSMEDSTLAILNRYGIFGQERDANFAGNFYREDEMEGKVEATASRDRGVNGRTIEELRNPLTYQLVIDTKVISDNIFWDFEDIWFMDLTNNNGLPMLRWEDDVFATEPSLHVTMPSYTLTYGESTSQAAIATEGLVEVYGEVVEGEFTIMDNFSGFGFGTTTMRISFIVPDDSSFLSFQGIAEVTVSKADLTITADDATKVYGEILSFDGTEFTTHGLTEFDSVNTIDLSSIGATTGAAIGTYDIVASNASGSGLSNYNITYVVGTLTVTPRAIEVTAATDVKDEDGSSSSVGIPTLTSGSLADGHTGNWSQSFDDENFGENKTITPEGNITSDSDNTDVTENYDITFVTAIGSINPIR
ncbi:MAG: S-layer homology domain-containing protein [Dethiosulfatibacter sp.]|nr:S-layer homology domain-containing protein [Dethiosulfatibacter sp.]